MKEPLFTRNTWKQFFGKKLRTAIARYFGENAVKPWKKSLFIIWLIEKIFWILIYTVGGVITAILCVDLSLEFKAGETINELELLFKTQVELPSATLCLPIAGRILGPPTWFTGQMTTESPKGQLYNEAKEYFRVKCHNKTEFLSIGKGITWPLGVTKAVLSYFTQFSQIELDNEIEDYTIGDWFDDGANFY